MRFSKCTVVVVLWLACLMTAGGLWLVPPAMDHSADEDVVKSATPACAAESVCATESLVSLDRAPHPGVPDGEWTPAVLAENPPELIENLQFCFAPGTSNEEMEFYHQLVYGYGADGLPRYFLGSRWSGLQGNPASLTWSFVPDGTSITDSTGGVSNLFAQMDSKFAAQGGRATWINRIQQCFDRWEELAGVSFTRITTGGNDWDDGASWPNNGGTATRGQIRICGRTLGVGGTLAYAYFPQTGDMLIDMAENWGSSNNQHRFLRNTVMHEMGHCLGLAHVCSGNSQQLLEPFLQESFDGPRHDDIRGVHRHYGDIYEIDNTSGAATHIGVVEQGSPIALGALPPPPTGLNPTQTTTLSIDTGAEVDFFRFTVNGPREATVTIAPRGITYDNQAQLGNGNCPGCCVNTDSLSIGDLNVQIIGTNGSTVLATGAGSPAGSAETLSGVLLPVAGDYYVRVYAGNSFTQAQFYDLNLSVIPACEDPVVDPISHASTACEVAFVSSAPSASGTPPLTWSLDGSPPAGMTIDSGTGIISWPSPVASMTPYSITVKATGGCAGEDTQSFQLAVWPGDFNGDGNIDMLDVPAFNAHLLGLSSSQPCSADVNMDGDIDGLDIDSFVEMFLTITFP